MLLFETQMVPFNMLCMFFPMVCKLDHCRATSQFRTRAPTSHPDQMLENAWVAPCELAVEDISLFQKSFVDIDRKLAQVHMVLALVQHQLVQELMLTTYYLQDLWIVSSHRMHGKLKQKEWNFDRRDCLGVCCYILMNLHCGNLTVWRMHEIEWVVCYAYMEFNPVICVKFPQ